MKKTALIILLLLALSGTYGQHTPIDPVPFDYRNSVQVELGGHGLVYSLNYERILLNNPGFKTSVQAGFAYYPPESGIIDLWIPVLVNGIVSFNQHHLEFGIGRSFTIESVSNAENLPTTHEFHGFMTGRLGYRLQKPGSRFVMRAAFTPLLNLEGETEFHPNVGLSFGYAF